MKMLTELHYVNTAVNFIIHMNFMSVACFITKRVIKHILKQFQE